MRVRILVVSSAGAKCRSLQASLDRAGFEPHAFYSAAETFEWLAQPGTDAEVAIIHDDLPDMRGQSFATILEGYGMAVIRMTASVPAPDLTELLDATGDVVAA